MDFFCFLYTCPHFRGVAMSAAVERVYELFLHPPILARSNRLWPVSVELFPLLKEYLHGTQFSDIATPRKCGQVYKKQKKSMMQLSSTLGI